VSKFVLFASVCLLLCGAGVSWANVVLEYPLPQGDPVYIRDIGPIEVTNHSLIEIYIENVLDEQRWKEWDFKIWVPEGTPAVTAMLVDYDNTVDHSNPSDFFGVSLAPIPETAMFGGEPYDGYYADTTEDPWLGYGTTPVGSEGDYPFGNPMWVGFHVQVDVPDTTAVFFTVHDECIPEPATLSLLALGVVALLRKRKA